MKKNIFAAICIAFVLIAGFTACKEDNNTEVTYKGTVVNKLTAQPFPNLEVKVTDGEHINQTVHTDAMGMFSLLVRFNEINSKYYLLIGDSSCVPVKKEFKGFGQKEIDLGIIEVEGPTAPIVKTVQAANITAEGATLGGNVAEDGRATVTDRGICWSENQYPELNKDAHQSCGNGIGTFITTVNGLKHNTTYYFRAYATNRVGTSYGEQYQFTTTSGEAVVLTDSVFAVTAVSAKCAATVVSDGGYQVTERGICWSKTPDPTKTDFIATEGSGTGSYACALRNLDVNTEYYVRAFATNSVGTVYGEQYKFSTTNGLATVTTTTATNITATTITCGGNVTDDGTLSVTARGVCYSTSQYPTINDAHTNDGKGKGTFTSQLKDLKDKTAYYYRAYATTDAGTAYGEQKTFTTADGSAVVTIEKPSDIKAASAILKGEVTKDGGVSVTARGFCYSTTQYPTIDATHTTNGNGTGTFSATISNLTPSTTYYVRAYATNSTGTTYSKQEVLTTQNGLPILTTTAITGITSSTAQGGGEVSDDSGFTVTTYGLCWATTSNPTINNEHSTDGKGKGIFTHTITGLAANTTYYVRAYATNSIGTAYGENQSFTTADGKATVITSEVSNITALTATGGGNVTDAGGATIKAVGICWATHQNPTITDNKTSDGKTTGAFTASLTNLTPNTTYYVRAYVTTDVTTTYGQQVSFKTASGLPVLTTATASATSAVITTGGNISSDGGYAITARGVCWSETNSNPDLKDSTTVNGKGTGNYTSSITGLKSNTTYYIRAYATNQIGTAYGNAISIKTQDGKAGVTTADISNITALTATGGGNVTDAGGATIKAVGICWATTQNPTIANSHTTDGSSLGSFTSNLTDLQPSTTYYVRAYVTTNITTTYGQQVSFTTSSGLPTLTTASASSTAFSISTGGNIKTDGGYAITARGVCWSMTNSNPDTRENTTTDGKGTGTFTSTFSNLSPNTTYYVRAYATNTIGTAYGQALTIKTKDGKASVNTVPASNVTSKSATLGVQVTDAGGATIKAVGICWSTTQNPTITDNHTTEGNSTGSYSGNLTDLLPSTTYYARGYATTDVTTSYGQQVQFTTQNGLPILTTIVAGENVTETTAQTGGQITDDGGFNITARGVCWATLPNPTINSNHTSDGTGKGNFTSSITGIDITGSNVYYVRAYATNANGTTYGQQVLISKQNLDYRNLPSFEYGGYTYRLYNDMGNMSWDAAETTCQSLNYAGYDDWFLPDIDELRAAWSATKEGWKIEAYDTYSTYVEFYAGYWSASESSSGHYYAYLSRRVYSNNNSTYDFSQSPSLDMGTYRVRAVRKSKIK